MTASKDAYYVLQDRNFDLKSGDTIQENEVPLSPERRGE